MDESIERRALTLLAVNGLVIGIGGGGAAASYSGVEWHAVVYMIGLASFVASMGLCGLLLAPPEMNAPFALRRPAVFFWATIAFGLGISLIAVNGAAAAFDLIKHAEELGGSG